MIETALAASGEVAGKGLSIHLAPQVLTHVGTLPITNTLITAWLVVFLVLTLTFLFRNSYRLIPSKGQILLETMIGGAFDYVAETLESAELAKKFFPIIMTIFIFILSLNWIGLLPGVDSIGIFKEHLGRHALVGFLHPANTDLNVTLAFAIIAFFTIEVAGVVLIGFWKYAGKFVNVKSFSKGILPGILGFVIGLIELIGEIARLISFSFRLFGNIFAGKTLLLVAIFFVPFVVPVPILAFEVFVGFIQALVFSVLTLFFIKLAISEHSAEEHPAH